MAGELVLLGLDREDQALGQNLMCDLRRGLSPSS
jgi:hypothetical protein